MCARVARARRVRHALRDVMSAPAVIAVEPTTIRPGLVQRLMALSIIPANLIGAVTVYCYYTWVDPLGGGRVPEPTHALAFFLAVVIPLLAINWTLAAIWMRPLRIW